MIGCAWFIEAGLHGVYLFGWGNVDQLLNGLFLLHAFPVTGNGKHEYRIGDLLILNLFQCEDDVSSEVLAGWLPQFITDLPFISVWFALRTACSVCPYSYINTESAATWRLLRFLQSPQCVFCTSTLGDHRGCIHRTGEDTVKAGWLQVPVM